MPKRNGKPAPDELVPPAPAPAKPKRTRGPNVDRDHISRERVRQIEQQALWAARRKLIQMGFDKNDLLPD